jgi:predicted amidohydrolase
VNIRVALAQTAVTGDKAANLDAIASFTALAARRRARLAVFPEASMYHFGRPHDPLAPAGESLDGPFVSALAALARLHGIWLIAGMFERIEGDRRVYNTLVLVDDGGTPRGFYRKIHLYDAFGYAESARIAPGDGSTLEFDIDGVRFGALTCYDLRFPELARHITRAGAQVLVLPAAWLAGPGKELQFEALLRARAIENTVYVGSADQCTEGFCGNSVLYDPAGVVVASLGEAAGVIVADVSAERVSEVRGRNPSLANARVDLYARWAEAAAEALTVG